MQITIKELQETYHNNSNDKAAEKLGISIVTLLKKVDKYGIKRKGSGSHNRTDRLIILEDK